MSALTQWVTKLDERMERVAASRRAHIPSTRYSSASVLLEQLTDPLASLCHRHRFAEAVTGSDGGVSPAELRESLSRLLRSDFEAFAAAHLTRDPADLRSQVTMLKAAIDAQINVLNAHVERFRKATLAHIEQVRVQVNLFAALGIANHTDEIGKLSLRFTVLMRRYEELIWTESTPRDWQALDRELTALAEQVTFDQRVGLSEEALRFVQRILAGPKQAPSLLELSPSVLAEIQKLPEFARTVRIMRPE